MGKLQYNQTQYVTSATKLAELPSDHGLEIAFIGRSNAGKSSAINAITGVNGLARTSSTPGRTQMINFFEVNTERRLVDLPGYGYAKTTHVNRARWDQMIHDYFESRESLVGLVLVMDARHPLRPQDQEMIQWCVDSDVFVHILLSKADKLSKDAAKKTLFSVEKVISPAPNVSAQLFSALKKTGVDAARIKLDEWFKN